MKFLFWLGLVAIVTPQLRASDLEKLATSTDFKQSSSLAKKLQADPDTDLLTVLEAMKGKSDVNKNWLLSVAQTVADRDPKSSMASLDQFLPRLSEDSAARYWAFTYVTRGDNAKREKLLDSMLADPSLELRYAAVALALKNLEANETLSDKARVAAYQEYLAAARLPTQIQSIAEKLEELGQEVDLRRHFGFVSNWQTVGPFNNVDKVGFGEIYQPESDYLSNKMNTKADYDGKTDKVAWQSVSTEAEDGAVDLAVTFNKEKGAVAYVLGEFLVPDELQCQVRLGSKNASKVWINGELVISREVYHSGGQIDQYVAPVKLKKGTNSILLKSCQNEQEQSWAQDWAFQLRFTDDTGYAIQPLRRRQLSTPDSNSK
ncbi:MAG: hypothetical protein AAF483_25190 [Planctomycetota bacterium]